MTEPVLIGRPVVDNASAIAALQRSVLEHGWGEARAAASLLQDSTAICRVARAGPEILGFVLCRLAADECEVLSCAVDPAFRRRGTARFLLRAVFAEAADRGARHVFLEVAEDNAPARGLYAGLGFATIGRRSRYYQRHLDKAVDALVMRLVL